jgi:hypothetical protein
VLSGHTHYKDLEPWIGEETADIVYLDNTGGLTRYLRENCVDDFPVQIPLVHDHTTSPIEYYLEAKSTTSHCGTQFYMSGLQYKRVDISDQFSYPFRHDRNADEDVLPMESMALSTNGPTDEVFVILIVQA